MSTQRLVLKGAGSVGDNLVRLDTEETEQAIGVLNTDLADAYALYHQLHRYHWNVKGVEHLRIREFLQEAYEEVEGAANEIAERLQPIGGVPHASMPALSEAVTVEPEDEDVYDIHTSPSNDLEMYGDIIESYREHIEFVADLRGHTTAYMFREQFIEIEEHAHIIDHYLEDNTPVQ